MNQALLSSLLVGERLGRRLECYPALASTGDRARELLDQLGPAAHGAVVTADRQTAGRGRMGRTWHTAPGKSLALTVALWPGTDPAGFGVLPLAAALAVQESLAETGVTALLKWPNDVLVGQRKIAGVLLEGRFSGDEQHGLTLGIGVNVSQSREEFPEEIRDLATSIFAEAGAVPELERFAADLLNALDPLLAEALAAPASVVERARGRWAHRVGQPLTLQVGTARREGRFAGVGPGGELLLETERGVEAVHSGEVSRLGPGGAP